MHRVCDRRTLYYLISCLLVILCLPALAASAQPPTTPFLRLETGMHIAPIWRIDVDAQERFLVTASQDKTARVWNLASGELLRVLRPPLDPSDEGILYAVAISPDGATVATAGLTGYEWDKKYSIYLFDRASGRLDRRIPGLPDAILHLAYSPDGRYLAAALMTDGMRVFATHDLGEIARDTDYGDRSEWVEFDHLGRLLTTCRDGYVRLYNTDFRRIAKRKAPGGARPLAARFSPDGAHVAVGFDSTTTVNVLSGKDLVFLYAPDTAGMYNGDFSKIAWSRDGQRLYAGGQYFDSSGINLILQWSQAGHGPFTTLPAATNTITGLYALSGGRLAYGAMDPAFGVFSHDGARLWGQGPATVDYRGRHGELRLSSDGSVVEFGFRTLTSQNRWQHHLARLHMVTGQLLFEPPPLAALQPPHTKGLPISAWFNSYTPKLNGKPLPLTPYEQSRRLAIAPDGKRFLLGTEWRLVLFNRTGQQVWQVPVPGTTRAVNISGDGRLAIAAFGDGTLRWYRMTDGTELLALFLHAGGARWVIWTPEGFFDASSGGETLIGYHLNQGPDTAGKFVQIKQLYTLFSRPELVAQRLDEDTAPALREALAKIGDVRQVLAVGLPPTLELKSPPESQQSEREFTLAFMIKEEGGGIGRVVYRVNGVTVGDSTARPMDISVPYHRRPFTLPPGRNVISATVFNKNGTVESTPIEAVVHVHADERRPSLHVLALGVANYRDRALNLRYAASDARAMAEMLKKSGQGLFTSVQVTLLLDQDATRRGIEGAFRELAGKIQQHDVFVLYLAGHGTTLDGEYLFIPWDLVYENQQALHQGSINQDRFQQWLGMIKAQKSLILLDTCRSGAFVAASSGTLSHLAAARDLAEKGAIDKLMRATGQAVIAASTERQLALEGYENHGMFTYVLLQGLRGEADAKGKPDGQITIDELATYVAEEVPRLTLRLWGYEQFPMRQIEGRSFLIGLVR